MKRNIFVFIALILMVLQMPVTYGKESVSQQNSTMKTKGVLLIYDQLAVDTVYQSNLFTIQTLLSTLSQSAEITSMDDYSDGRLSAYQKVIILKNTKNPITNLAFIADCQNYSGATLYIGFAAPELIPELDNFLISRQLGRTVSLSINELVFDSIWVDDLRVIDEPSGPGEVTIGVGLATYPFSKTVGRLTYVPTFVSDPEIGRAHV